MLDKEEVSNLICDHAARWANNTICELLNNYGGRLSKERRHHLKEASRALAEFLAEKH